MDVNWSSGSAHYRLAADIYIPILTDLFFCLRDGERRGPWRGCGRQGGRWRETRWRGWVGRGWLPSGVDLSFLTRTQRREEF